MIHKSLLPKDIEERLGSLGQALERCPSLVFAYLFGGVVASPIKPQPFWRHAREGVLVLYERE